MQMLHGIIVEDDKLIRLMLKKVLESKGFEIQEACNGLEGFELFEKTEKKIDFILTDFMMPYLNGIEMAERIRATEKGKSITLIGMTAAEEGMFDKEQVYFNKLLRKPFKISDIHQLIIDVMKGDQTSNQANSI
ncbi:response regulator [Cecembia lonarensis]|uniref:Respiratory response protein A n=1 Tax=Cecembia lonarensis (strain CCUG 58316 / KCTC 22772 / LW9) TaxID=1225176 RepID=K1L3T5_CECL9|nr:response regulator [Cecembia lonarensis]EKB51110.1 Respiratory response protein A [Cecembia lonarensis LW9]